MSNENREFASIGRILASALAIVSLVSCTDNTPTEALPMQASVIQRAWELTFLDFPAYERVSENMAVAVNNTGRLAVNAMVCESNIGCKQTALLWHNDQTTDVGSLGAWHHNTLATAINDESVIVGYSLGPMSEYRAFRWSAGVIQDLGTLGRAAEWSEDHSAAYGINRAGVIVGSSIVGDANRAVVWRAGKIKDLGTLGGYHSVAYAINDRGKIVGESNVTSGEYHAFLWWEGRMTDLGTLGGANSSAYAINEAGQVVGVSVTASGKRHAFLWRNGEMIDLIPNSLRSTAHGIDDRGRVVGYFMDPSFESNAFLWSDGVLTNLGRPANASNSTAVAINERGLIIGRAWMRDLRHSEAVLWRR